MTWKVYVQYEPWRHASALHILREERDATVFVKNMTMERVDHGGAIVSDGAINGRPEEIDDFLRAMMNAAWERGLRPDGYENHTNELAAVRFHLDDMRKLAKVK